MPLHAGTACTAASWPRTVVGYATGRLDESEGSGEVGNNAIAPEVCGRGYEKLGFKELARSVHFTMWAGERLRPPAPSG